MAKSKTPRKKKHMSSPRRQAAHVNRVIQIAMQNFQIIGDQCHAPRSFGFSKLSENLSAKHAMVAEKEILTHLFYDRQIWSVLILFFFKEKDNIEMYPVHLELENTTLGEVGANFEETIADARKALIESTDEISEDSISYYGYLTTFGGNLNLEKMEGQLAKSFLHITKDLTEIRAKVDVIGQSMADAIRTDKFSLVNRTSLKTEFKESKEGVANV